MSSPSQSTPTSKQQFWRGNWPMLLALFLALALVVAVLVGAKLVYEKAANQPVAMSVLDTPDANSAECADFVATLPEELLGLDRAELVEPAPNGAAAWQQDSQTRITLRCGVDLPLQYNALSLISEQSGTHWLEVADTTPQSTMRTWYSVNRWPVVAITADDASAPHTAPTGELSAAMDSLEVRQAAFNPTPLAQLTTAIEAGGTSGGSEGADLAQRCEDLLASLPETFGTGPTYTAIDAIDATENGPKAQALEGYSRAWVAPGHEAVVIRCAVDFPQSYEAGAQLQQINEIAWFEDTTLGNGTTASVWYGLGRDIILAVSTPQAAVDSVLVPAGEALVEHSSPQEGEL